LPVTKVGEVGVELKHLAPFRERGVVVATKQEGVGEMSMRERQRRIQGYRLVRQLERPLKRRPGLIFLVHRREIRCEMAACEHGIGARVARIESDRSLQQVTRRAEVV